MYTTGNISRLKLLPVARMAIISLSDDNFWKAKKAANKTLTGRVRASIWGTSKPRITIPLEIEAPETARSLKITLSLSMPSQIPVIILAPLTNGNQNSENMCLSKIFNTIFKILYQIVSLLHLIYSELIIRSPHTHARKHRAGSDTANRFLFCYIIFVFTKFTNSQLAFFFGRLLYGVNFFAHGLVRIPKLNKFMEWILNEFKDTMIPKVLLEPYAFLLVFLELVVGVSLVFGFKTRFFLIISNLILISLSFGACIQEAWPRVGVQMVYAIFNYQLLRDYSNQNDILSITKR